MLFYIRLDHAHPTMDFLSYSLMNIPVNRIQVAKWQGLISQRFQRQRIHIISHSNEKGSTTRRIGLPFKCKRSENGTKSKHDLKVKK